MDYPSTVPLTTTFEIDIIDVHKIILGLKIGNHQPKGSAYYATHAKFIGHK